MENSIVEIGNNVLVQFKGDNANLQYGTQENQNLREVDTPLFGNLHADPNFQEFQKKKEDFNYEYQIFHLDDDDEWRMKSGEITGIFLHTYSTLQDCY